MRQALGAASIVLLCVASFFLGVAFAPSTTAQVQEVRYALSEDEVFHQAQDRIAQEQIKVYGDRVQIDIDDATFAPVGATASMLPFLHSGTHSLEVHPKSESTLSIGDIISFSTEQGMVIHAIEEIGVDEQGWFARTKGYNNQEIDPWKVRFSDIDGVLVGVLY